MVAPADRRERVAPADEKEMRARLELYRQRKPYVERPEDDAVRLIFADWLDEQLRVFDSIYSPNRPRYIDGYNQLKAAIKPWGTK